MIDTLKFVWAHMIESGNPTNGEWNYYGSGFEYPVRMDWRGAEKAMKTIREKILKFGVDWSRTETPVTDENSCFDGTEVPSSRVPTLCGTIYLNDGSAYMIGVSNTEVRFAEYVKNIVSLTEDRERVRKILGE